MPTTSIKSLDASPKTMTIKRTAGFVKAAKELSRHQELLEQASAMNDDDNQSAAENDLDEDHITDVSLLVQIFAEIVFTVDASLEDSKFCVDAFSNLGSIVS